MTATMTRPSLAERVVTKVAQRFTGTRTSRRGFIGGAAVVGAALAVDPLGYLTRPASAIDAICGSDSSCAAGYTVFCCTINGGSNTCPPDSFIGGWWKADHSSFCGGNARYYIDCNAYRDGRYTCHCNTTTCDQRRVACNQFRYGQCNTQIPWSNTGPVLCRVVSCTPPWQQYAGTCSSSSATDNNTATHSAPCLAGRVPVGHVDTVSSSNGKVRVRGWAYDPDQPGTSLSIAIYADNKPLMGIHASLPRADVNSSQHITGNHGFDVTFDAPAGRHTYVAYALNIGPGSGNTRLGGGTVIVADVHSPIGHMDYCNPITNGVVIAGWALDRDTPSTAGAVNIYQDGKPLLGVRCSIERADVNSHYGVSGLHGFKVRLDVSPGAHSYQLYAMNTGAGSTNTLIGSHSLVVPGAAAATAWHRPLDDGAPPVAGALESVVATGNSVRLTGWAADAGAATITVLVDGEQLHWHRADTVRADGTRAGFDLTVPAARGLHTYTVSVLGTATAELGTRTVRVDQAGAIGRISNVDAGRGTVRLTGWAYDPEAPDRSLELLLYRDGAVLSRHRTGRAAPPDAPPEAETGRPGFSVSTEDEPGRHTYSLYVPAGAPGATPVLLGTCTVDNDAAVTV